MFISFITATANDVCKERKRATINADDVFQALEDLEFGDLLPALRESYEGERLAGRRDACLLDSVCRHVHSAPSDVTW